MTAAHHVLDIYGAELHLCTDRRQLATLRRRLPMLEKSPGGMGASSITAGPNGKGTHLVVFIDVKGHDEAGSLIDTAAHEATHAGALLLDHIGQGYDGNSEALAYLIGWLTRWLWEGCS